MRLITFLSPARAAIQQSNNNPDQHAHNDNDHTGHDDDEHDEHNHEYSDNLRLNLASFGHWTERAETLPWNISLGLTNKEGTAGVNLRYDQAGPLKQFGLLLSLGLAKHIGRTELHANLNAGLVYATRDAACGTSTEYLNWQNENTKYEDQLTEWQRDFSVWQASQEELGEDSSISKYNEENPQPVSTVAPEKQSCVNQTGFGYSYGLHIDWQLFESSGTLGNFSLALAFLHTRNLIPGSSNESGRDIDGNTVRVFQAAENSWSETHAGLNITWALFELPLALSILLGFGDPRIIDDQWRMQPMLELGVNVCLGIDKQGHLSFAETCGHSH